MNAEHRSADVSVARPQVDIEEALPHAHDQQEHRTQQAQTDIAV
jgi:hypothetical protein